MKKSKLTVNMVVKIKGCKKDFGQGVGVIGSQKAVFTDERSRGFDSPLFAMSLEEKKQELVNSLVEVQLEFPKK